MMQLFKEKLLQMNFEQERETMFIKKMPEPLFATSCTWPVFAFCEDGKYYFSSDCYLVEAFDAPDIDIDFMLEEIDREIGKFGCFLKVSNIMKIIDIKNIERDLEKFISAVLRVDEMYRSL